MLTHMDMRITRSTHLPEIECECRRGSDQHIAVGVVGIVRRGKHGHARANHAVKSRGSEQGTSHGLDLQTQLSV